MTDSFTSMIDGKDAVVETLGYWPEFADAKVTELMYWPCSELGARLSVLLHYIDTDKGLDVDVKIELNGIREMEFNELDKENVIDAVSLLDSSDGGVEFEIEACAGFFGGCVCDSANVQLVSTRSYPA